MIALLMTLPRLYPILDTAALARRNCPVVTAAEAMLEGGARILQFRHKGHFTRAVFEQAGQVAVLCRKAGALFIVNDRADIALLLEAGVHVGQDDLPAADARRLLGPERVLGLSTHTREQFAAALAEPVDYLAFGPIFLTGSKEKPDPAVGLEGLRGVRGLTARPLVAIGGIQRSNVLEVFACGADAVAVIGDLTPEPCTFETLRARMEEWQQLVRP